MWQYWLASALVALWWFVLRPRGGGKGSPPLVTESKVFPMIPFVGVISEFLKSPNDMMTRCLKDYGSVFTIPVSAVAVVLLVILVARSAQRLRLFAEVYCTILCFVLFVPLF